MKWIIIAGLMLALAGAAHAAEDCVLEVDGTRYIDGPCTFTLREGGSFQMGVYPEDGVAMRFAVVLIEDEGAIGYWNGEPAESHAHEPLGPLRRDGACWLNDRAKVCAYRE